MQTPLWLRGVSFLGLFVMLGVAWLLSSQRRQIQLRPVLWGLGLQLALGVVILNPSLQGLFFELTDLAVRKLLSFSEAGASFVFQTVEPHQVLDMTGQPQTVVGRISPPVKTFAFWILPSIVFFSSLMAILYHVGVMQRVVWGAAWVMRRTMRISAAESLAAAANIFVGQVEAPLVVRPYVERMTRSELCVVMTGGFATVAGGVLAAYVGFLRDIPGIAGHLVTASILSAPAAVAIAKVLEPETGHPETRDGATLERKSPYTNAFEAAATGASDGAKLALGVGAMLIAFVGLVALADAILGMVSVGEQPLSLARVLGWLFSPFALAMGVPWEDCLAVGALLGEKLVLTEFIAYVHLGQLVSEGGAGLQPRSVVLCSYALCGFANFASIGIQLGGIGGIAPTRLGELSGLALRAMLGGTLAAFMTACVAGIFIA